MSAGQVNECTQCIPLLESVHVGRHHYPAMLLGDKAYSTRSIRAWARQHHIRLMVPERVDQVAQRAHRPGRKPDFQPARYRQRNVIERAVGWLKRWRRIATRCEKLAVCYQAVVALALTARYAARYFSDTT